MHTYIPLNTTTHSGKGWRKADSLQHASGQSVLPVILDELPHCTPTMPLALVPRTTDNQEAFDLVALTSLTPGLNLFLAPNGRWLGGYVPACLRGYPFRMLPDPASKRMLLCFDQDSGLMTEQATESSEPFFKDSGELSDTLKRITQFLQKCEQGRQATRKAVDLLAKHQLIEEWPLHVKGQEHEKQRIQGIYRINEAALRALSADALKELQDGNALPLAYAQMMSQHRISGLARLYELHAKLQQADNAMSEEQVESYFEGKDDTLSFNF